MRDVGCAIVSVPSLEGVGVDASMERSMSFLCAAV